MLRREIVIGFVAAGFATVAVPAGFWNAVFLHGHGSLTMIENAIVGPFVAIISFVCSIGNVPLAAALWKDGISFVREAAARGGPEADAKLQEAADAIARLVRS